jgi:hypothetical protein
MRAWLVAILVGMALVGGMAVVAPSAPEAQACRPSCP